MSIVFTIGYEGATVDSVLAALERNGIDHVIDVRRNPTSRKKGFSKWELAEAVGGRGISYSHWPQLGCPKDIRAEYEERGDFERYARAYEARIIARSRSILSRLARSSRDRRVCLLCFEADAGRCHRSLVAAQAARLNRGLTGFCHLVVPSSDRTSRAP